jgi:hypothetical protein
VAGRTGGAWLLKFILMVSADCEPHISTAGNLHPPQRPAGTFPAQPGPRFIGANAMRSLLALGLLITLCASAGAATAQHSRHDVIVHQRHEYAIPGWTHAAPRPVHYDDAPSYNDPSKSGCCN